MMNPPQKKVFSIVPLIFNIETMFILKDDSQSTVLSITTTSALTLSLKQRKFLITVDFNKHTNLLFFYDFQLYNNDLSMTWMAEKNY